MDTRTGRIYTKDDAERYINSFSQEEREKIRAHFKEMEIPPTAKQVSRRPYPKVGRNEPCPCGSGKKFKKCCLDLRS